MASTRSLPGTWDRVGIGLSGLCAVHCMAMPVVMVSLPLWPMADAVHAWVHPLFVLALLPVTAVALRATRGKPEAKAVRVLLSGGLLIVALAALVGHETGGEMGETAFTLLGSGLLVLGHWRNEQICRRCVH